MLRSAIPLMYITILACFTCDLTHFVLQFVTTNLTPGPSPFGEGSVSMRASPLSIWRGDLGVRLVVTAILIIVNQFLIATFASSAKICSTSAFTFWSACSDWVNINVSNKAGSATLAAKSSGWYSKARR